MPTYTFRCQKCAGEFEFNCRMSELGAFKEDMANPETPCPCGDENAAAEKLMDASNFSMDGYKFMSSKHKPPSNFLNRLAEIKKAHPTLEGRYVGNRTET